MFGPPAADAPTAHAPPAQAVPAADASSEAVPAAVAAVAPAAILVAVASGPGATAASAHAYSVPSSAGADSGTSAARRAVRCDRKGVEGLNAVAVPRASTAALKGAMSQSERLRKEWASNE